MMQTKQPLNLPAPVAAYFRADAADCETLSRCFTEYAVVKDEGHTYTGRTEIRNWKDEVSRKYEYTSKPHACEQKDGKTVVTSRVEGNFPGSPIDLRFLFRLEGDKISSLEIKA